MKLLKFNEEVLCSCFIFDPVNNKEFTFNQSFESAKSLYQDNFKALDDGDKILLISSDVYLIFSFILSSWIHNFIPAIISPNLNIIEYRKIIKRMSINSIYTDIQEIHCNLGIPLINFKFSTESRMRNTINFSYEAEQTAIILFSSGSTGKQKIIPLSFNNILSNIYSFSQAFLLKEKTTFLCTSPVWFAHGLYNSILTCFFLQKKVIFSGLLSLFNASKLLEASAKESGLIYHLTPSMIPILLSVSSKMNTKDLPKFAYAICGTSFLDQKSKFSFEKIFKTKLIQQYGMTEVLYISFNNKPIIKPKSVGRPLEIVKIKIWNGKILEKNQEGQILINSPSFCGGYLDESNLKITNNEGYFITGDIGYIDDDGYLFITGREKDLIKKGGVAISSSEINTKIEGYEKITKAITISQLDENVGEEIYCFITATTKIKMSNLKDYLRDKLTPSLMPKKIYQIKNFPLNEMGKISREDLINILMSKNV